MTDINEEKKRYDLTVLLKEEAEKQVLEALGKYGAEGIKQVYELQKIRLAYPIKKIAHAFMIAFQFDMPPAKLANLKKDLKMNQGIIRHLLIVHKDDQGEDEKVRSTRRKTPDRSATSLLKDTLVTNEALEKQIEEILK